VNGNKEQGALVVEQNYQSGMRPLADFIQSCWNLIHL